MTVDPLPDWVIPPPGGFTVEDFVRLDGLPRHTELIDGSLIFVSPQEKWHSRVVSRFLRELDRQAPPQWRADREMTVKLGARQMPKPDVIVVSAEAYEREAPSTHYFAADVVLAVQAVSPDSEERDRDTKPVKYARAGIPHYWRIERRGSDAVAYLYEIDPATDRYSPAGIFHDRLRSSVPFPIDIDLTEVGRRG
ncbi:Uma2 family endonuclease [Nocardia sp. NPDC057227]|uniref:Uma2 family endonuclease n=1 Tax=Nocardia sp. NPDC057227 TaxID=3346056 RepID=UPI00362C4164